MNKLFQFKTTNRLFGIFSKNFSLSMNNFQQISYFNTLIPQNINENIINNSNIETPLIDTAEMKNKTTKQALKKRRKRKNGSQVNIRVR